MSDLDSSFDSSHDTDRFGMDDVDSLSDQSIVNLMARSKYLIGL